MRIAISGSHGVGKTTLTNRLAQELCLPIISEVARTVARDFGFSSTKQIVQAKQVRKFMFQMGVFYNQMIEEKKYSQGFVSDRSIFDSVAYSIYYGLLAPIIKDKKKQAAEHSKSYDMIIYCPIPEIGIEEDGFRLSDKKSQLAVDRHIISLLDLAQCKVIRLSRNRDNWTEEVLQHFSVAL